MPVICKEVEESSVGDNHDVLIPAAGNLPQRPPGLPASDRELLQRGLVPAAGALFGPRLLDAGVVGLALELGPHLGHGRPDVAGLGGDLLEDGQGGDGEQARAGAEGVEARVDGAAHGRGQQPGELVVVGERGAERGALLLAERGQVRVRQLLVLDGQVVEALGVADEMDCRGHVVCVK